MHGDAIVSNTTHAAILPSDQRWDGRCGYGVDEGDGVESVADVDCDIDVVVIKI